MNPFAVLNSSVELREAVAHKPEIRFIDQENGTVVCSYIISCDGTFDDKYSREARGVVFDKNDRVIGRPLHKFFNLNQITETQFNALDWSKVARISDKRDGSMIHTVKVVDDMKPFHNCADFTLKSKKSFESDVAVQARDFITKGVDRSAVVQDYIGLGNEVVARDKTAIFEWTSPTARIVLAYPKDELTLLHVRDNVTGEYSTRAELEALAKTYNVPLVDDRADLLATPKTEADFMKFHLETEDIEGIIVQFEDGNMVKVKTAWYVARHGVMTNLRERDIAAMVLNESLDDVKSTLAGEGCDLTEINAIEARIVNDIDLMIEAVCSIVAENTHRSKKEMAMQFSSQGENHPYFKLIMQKYDGKDPDYKAFYERNYLKERFDLRQLNLLQSVAEEE